MEKQAKYCSSRENENSVIKILLVFFFIFTFILRIRNISMPILDQFSMRQTHTAITIQSFIRDGLNIFDYQTPILGPGSWSIPYEFPVYQATSYWVYKFLLLFGFNNIDIAGRIVNIVFFYLSVIVLFRFSRLLFNNVHIPILAVFCYVGSPFVIFLESYSFYRVCCGIFCSTIWIFFYKIS